MVMLGVFTAVCSRLAKRSTACALLSDHGYLLIQALFQALQSYSWEFPLIQSLSKQYRSSSIARRDVHVCFDVVMNDHMCPQSPADIVKVIVKDNADQLSSKNCSLLIMMILSCWCKGLLVSDSSRSQNEDVRIYKLTRQSEFLCHMGDSRSRLPQCSSATRLYYSQMSRLHPL